VTRGLERSRRVPQRAATRALSLRTLRSEDCLSRERGPARRPPARTSAAYDDSDDSDDSDDDDDDAYCT